MRLATSKLIDALMAVGFDRENAKWFAGSEPVDVASRVLELVDNDAIDDPALRIYVWSLAIYILELDERETTARGYAE